MTERKEILELKKDISLEELIASYGVENIEEFSDNELMQDPNKLRAFVGLYDVSGVFDLRDWAHIVGGEHLRQECDANPIMTNVFEEAALLDRAEMSPEEMNMWWLKKSLEMFGVKGGYKMGLG